MAEHLKRVRDATTTVIPQYVPGRQHLVDWVAASIVTGFLFTIIGEAINATWNVPSWLPGWLTQVQTVVLFSGFYFVTVGLAGVFVARRYGYGKFVGVALATLGSTVPFLIWGWVELPYQQRMQMWTAFQLDGEYRTLLAVALLTAIIAMGTCLAVGVTAYSLIRDRGNSRPYSRRGEK